MKKCTPKEKGSGSEGGGGSRGVRVRGGEDESSSDEQQKASKVSLRKQRKSVCICT